MSLNAHTGTAPSRSHLVGMVLGVTALLALIVTAFAWPASEVAPRDLPVAVVGPADAVAQLEAGAAAVDEDALDVTGLDSRSDAVTAIEERDVYAAFVLSADGTELLTASAASPAVAQLVQQLADHMAAAQPGQATIVTTDVVPLPQDDPRGLVFNAGALPIVLGGLVVGVLVAVLVGGGLTAVLTVLGVAAGAGMATVGLLQGWLGALEGSYWVNAGVVALGIAAIGLAVVGLRRLIGLPGIPVAALTILLLGNPLSGVATAPELLPAGWSTLGQLLPPGATGTALRSTAFFDGAGAGTALLVLACWVLAGATLALLPRRRRAAAPVVVEQQGARSISERQPA